MEHAISPDAGLTVDEVVEQALAIEDCAFVLTVADSQRVAMAAANRALGAHDIAPAAATLALDKHLLRAKLVSAGCPAHAVPPVRPASCARASTRARSSSSSHAEASAPCASASPRPGRTSSRWPPRSTRGPGDDDMLEEYFAGNELVAETFFDGEELSIDVVRQSGANRIAVAHGKAGLEYRDGTVLELGHVSPPVNVTAAQAGLATEFGTDGAWTPWN